LSPRGAVSRGVSFDETGLGDGEDRFPFGDRQPDRRVPPTDRPAGRRPKPPDTHGSGPVWVATPFTVMDFHLLRLAGFAGAPSKLWAL
jgi:hypothetical protein